MKRHVGRTVARMEKARLQEPGDWSQLQLAMTIASGARFGRIRIAALAARPQYAVRRAGLAPTRCERPAVRTDPMTCAGVELRGSAKNSATAQNADAGTSLIGETSMARNAGLVASSHAAASPIAGEPSRRPMANVIQTRSAPLSGGIQNMAQWPAMNFVAAIINGRPGAVTGTSDAPSTDGRYPWGVNVQMGSGHGAKDAIGTAVFSLNWSHRSACDTYA